MLLHTFHEREMLPNHCIRSAIEAYAIILGMIRVLATTDCSRKRKSPVKWNVRTAGSEQTPWDVSTYNPPHLDEPIGRQWRSSSMPMGPPQCSLFYSSVILHTSHEERGWMWLLLHVDNSSTFAVARSAHLGIRENFPPWNQNVWNPVGDLKSQ